MDANISAAMQFAEETKRALEEADAGEFAGEEEAEAFFARWQA
ncbi:MAG: hypothetical protein P4L55_16925 [Syntrophobacteraceae bacterium]|nr:hypothetical protein [Syntrophobacteraceae bacterium]